MQGGELKGQRVGRWEEAGGPRFVLGEKEQVSCSELLGREIPQMRNLQGGVKPQAVETVGKVGLGKEAAGLVELTPFLASSVSCPSPS